MRPTRRSWAGPGARPCAAGGRTERSPELGASTLPTAFPPVSSLLSSGGGAGQRHRGPLTPPVDGVGLGVLSWWYVRSRSALGSRLVLRPPPASSVAKAQVRRRLINSREPKLNDPSWI